MSDASLPAAAQPPAGVSLAIPRLRRLEVQVFRAPVQRPVRTSFGVMTDRPAVVVRLEDGDGAEGWGEVWCNFPTCGAEHRARLVASVLAPRLLGREFPSPEAAFHALTRDTHVLTLQTGEHGPLAQGIAGIDVALWDLVARRAELPLRRVLGGEPADAVPAYASGINPEAALETIDRVRTDGFTAFKVKIGFDPEADDRVVAETAGALRAGEQLMVDANQGWSLTQARQRLPALAAAGVRWLEEPLPADTPAADWAALAADTVVPLAAGENLAAVEDFTAAVDGGYLQVLQPDVCKWGGISACAALARYALQAGRRYCPHYLGGGIGLLASAQLLAAVGGDGQLEVDVNPNPLREELAGPDFRVRSGAAELPQGPGIGTRPALEALRPWRTLRLEESL